MGAVRLRDIGEVVEVGTSQLCNDYLNLGWALLATFAHGDTRHGKTLWYSLGWPRERGPSRHPAPAALDLSVVDPHEAGVEPPE